MRFVKQRNSSGDGGMVKEGLSRMSARLCFQLLSFSPQQICWLQTSIESAGFRNRLLSKQ